MDALTNFINERLLLRNAAGVSATELAATFRVWDRNRHCGRVDLTDAEDREVVEAFIEGALFILNRKV